MRFYCSHSRSGRCSSYEPENEAGCPYTFSPLTPIAPMTRTLPALGILGVTGVASVCGACKPAPATSETSLVPAAYATPTAVRATAAAVPAVEPRRVTLSIEGMTCGGCAISARRVLTRLDGVRSADVSYENRRAVVTYDASKVTIEQMFAAIETLGYKATLVA